ncbi:hypothetical protein N8D56_25705 (plasmid) [Devosia sp. A8/3-2]|nr:hypothetical protein N8D56_25705 [Devosia sp. A8/3-2]
MNPVFVSVVVICRCAQGLWGELSERATVIRPNDQPASLRFIACSRTPSA